MNTIHGYKIDFTDMNFDDRSVRVATYKYANFMDVQVQNDEVVAWAAVDTSQERVLCRLYVRETSDDIGYLWGGPFQYLGTVQFVNQFGHGVLHVFVDLIDLGHRPSSL